MPKRLTTEEFVSRAREVHGDRYDYSRVEYVNSKEKVEIICPEHGIFRQIPNSHLRGKGCKQCGHTSTSQKQALTISQFKEKASIIHKNKYKYHRVNYVNNHTKVEIICPLHGSFWQTPNSHLQGNGCKQCGILSRKKHRTYTTSEFIDLATERHGKEYDYSQTEYSNSKEPIEIVCRKHGSFWQIPNSHLNGSGCPDCSIEITAIKNTFTTEEFIEKSRLVHGEIYIYSKSEYEKSDIEIEIICRKHGSFWQLPVVHMRGHGCPICQSSKSEKSVAKLLTGWRIRFTHQKRFDACRHKYSLPFDFYFQLGKKHFLIECDGRHHFEPIDGWAGPQGFALTKYHDAIKNGFAIKYGFVLTRIPYTEFDNIEAILREVIEQHTGQALEEIQKVKVKNLTMASVNPHQWKQLNIFTDA